MEPFLKEGNHFEINVVHAFVTFVSWLTDDLRMGRLVKTAKLSRDGIGDLFPHGMRPKPLASTAFS